MQIPLFRLECGCNSYDWGKIGKTSAAAKYAAATSEDFSIEEEKPYAELWMGTHPSLPSKDVETGQSLLDLVQTNKALMSTEIGDRYGEKLPFLFKVLSINKALSIQAHPNKKLAEQLHAKDPKNYPDDNHKPEMTIAITPFEGLCGFRPLAEIAHFLSHVPALRSLIGDAESQAFLNAIKGKETSEDESDVKSNKEALKKAFTHLMNASKESIAKATKELLEEANGKGEKFAGEGGPTNTGEELVELVNRLNGQFPDDIGLFVMFFLNYVKLSPGEAMFLKADDIHAYISGDIIECMASSDNVVRAGFTPKYKDTSTLTTMLTYSYSSPSTQKMTPTDYPYVSLNSTAYSYASSAMLYDPPIDEFSVVRLSLKGKGAKATFEGLGGPSILICTQGKGSVRVSKKNEGVAEGFVFFVGATAECVVESSGQEEMVVFRAFCELEGRESKF
ncbi:mannose-6-phosphate isomeras-like protein [Aulographum hederae CBS 113979]|uniref:Mannose-6-phosphate isomerase n=1 Tax=Aulographum hederae CBS 113979 TaxID=1176131 RepID=A0A6G1GR45_9PEZI|nr:mannose-6-phosphate isomeras-like protein [Aulographum hederae CBS 113979]